jgi:hypothetical protein
MHNPRLREEVGCDLESGGGTRSPTKQRRTNGRDNSNATTMVVVRPNLGRTNALMDHKPMTSKSTSIHRVGSAICLYVR